MIIGRILAITFLFVLLLIPDVYAEYPTKTIGPETFNLIEGIKDVLSSIADTTVSSETLGGTDGMASGSSASSSIAVVTWTGGGADELASTVTNWSNETAPQNGDGAVFDGTSSKNCTWDLSITLALLNINSGYTGTVTISSDLTIDNDFTWTGNGSDGLASNPANWSGGVVPGDGDDVDFRGTEDCIWNINITPASLRLDPGYAGIVTLHSDLSIAGGLSIEGGSLNLYYKALNVEGDLLIGINGTLYATSTIITVKGNWTNRGTFESGTSTVILNGINQTIYGDNTFYNLVKITGIADTLYFEAGKTQTILNNLTLQGTAGNLLSLRSTQDGQYWYINPQGTRSVSFVDIKDLNNTNNTHIVPANSIDSGNNPNVNWEGNECES